MAKVTSGASFPLEVTKLHKLQRVESHCKHGRILLCLVWEEPWTRSQEARWSGFYGLTPCTTICRQLECSEPQFSSIKWVIIKPNSENCGGKDQITMPASTASVLLCDPGWGEVHSVYSDPVVSKLYDLEEVSEPWLPHL